MEHLSKSILFILALILTVFLGSSLCKDDPDIIPLPIPMNEFKCPQMGHFPHPNDQHKYYECLEHPEKPSTFLSFTYDCGEECFDKGMNDKDKCSSSACGRNDTREFGCLKEHMKEDAQKICQDETLRMLKRQKLKMVDFTAFRGEAFQNLKLSVRDVNLNIRQNYASLIASTGQNVFPVMIASDGEPDHLGVGGVFKIYFKDGSMRSILPVRPSYEICKCLAHLVRGVFSIVAPYFNSPNSINWQPPLKEFQHLVKNVQYLLQNEKLNLTDAEQTFTTSMLAQTIDYIDKAIDTNSVDATEYVNYAHTMAPLIDEAMQRAAQVQAEDTIPALLKLKEEMGTVEWRKMYVIIPTVWPVSLINTRLQAIGKVMSFDQIKSQVLMVEGTQSEDDAKTTLGRVVADRAAAQLIWGGLEGESMEDHIFSLSTQRDLVSSEAAIQQDNVCQKLKAEPERSARCSHHHSLDAIQKDDKITIIDKNYYYDQQRDLYATMLKH